MYALDVENLKNLCARRIGLKTRNIERSYSRKDFNIWNFVRGGTVTEIIKSFREENIQSFSGSDLESSYRTAKLASGF